MTLQDKMPSIIYFFLWFRTPMMYACYEGAINQVKDLLEVGSDTRIKDSKGKHSNNYRHTCLCQILVDSRTAFVLKLL